MKAKTKLPSIHQSSFDLRSPSKLDGGLDPNFLNQNDGYQAAYNRLKAQFRNERKEDVANGNGSDHQNFGQLSSHSPAHRYPTKVPELPYIFTELEVNYSAP